LEFRVIGINISNDLPKEINPSNAESLGFSKEFIQNQFKDSLKKINRNLSLQIQDLINIYGRFGWEHYFQGQIGSLITLYFKRKKKLDHSKTIIKLSPEEEAILQSLDNEQLP